MTFLAFVLLVASLWGIAIPTDAWTEAAIPTVRFVQTADLTHRYGCGEIVMRGWPDGRRDVVEIRVRWPDAECPPAYLETVVRHERAHAICWLVWSTSAEWCAEELDD